MNTAIVTNSFFDDIFDRWSSMKMDEFPFSSMQKSTTFPHYNVVKKSDNDLTIEMAIAGFAKDDVEITVENNKLTVSGSKTDKTEDNYLYKGIANRSFKRSFNLPEGAEVVSASHEDGILFIDLKHEIPEEKRPKQIPIY